MGTSATAARESFQTENLSIFYGSYEAVKGISLPFAKNTVTALIGPSGCGKRSEERRVGKECPV